MLIRDGLLSQTENVNPTWLSDSTHSITTQDDKYIRKLHSDMVKLTSSVFGSSAQLLLAARGFSLPAQASFSSFTHSKIKDRNKHGGSNKGTTAVITTLFKFIVVFHSLF